MLIDKKYIDYIKSRLDRRSSGWGLSFEDIEILIELAEEAAKTLEGKDDD